ncbi:hypothetical protein ACFP9V_19320 [Deinococcus radiopugnans]|uniref:Uncharacterized protein n=1 Tax=Deinococcus radiopugnans ATCC 19172 TaxID=585398 RepID=A0A5C4Y9Z7_9DEIO|nr:hypothetical protein [Deinococcus radiopugnans]MBB6016778.1 hypothetical protein [Deinococcus radiopugnans ATCC 19172]TNM71930.1 hypothetical protein FHR04_06070 [Deinococcus radiopugnans ATCC 19172]
MSEPRLTTEGELNALIARHSYHLTEVQVRDQFRWKCVITEPDPFDSTPDAYDTYLGYGPTALDAYARAYSQTYASERQEQAWQDMQ